MKPVLSVKNLTAGYGKISIVQNVSLDAYLGECVSVLGPNGSGKSTLFKAVFGLAKIFEGKVFFKDEDVSGMRGDMLIRRGMLYVPQLRNVFTSMTVYENLELGIVRRRGNDKQLIDEVFEMFPVLREKRNQKAGLLSGGQRQVLAMAKALLGEPEVLVLDEPTAGLAPRAVAEMMSVIARLKQRNLGLVLIEQNVKRALSISERAYIMAAGKVVYEGVVSELSNNKELAKIYLGIVS
ncbi:MAG: ABC transporter ATP-binding protein [Candidatus Caldarchaeum sp.]